LYTARQGAATKARERRYENEHRGTEATEGHREEERFHHRGHGGRREEGGRGRREEREREEEGMAMLTGMVNIAVFAAF
jgi:hypothetical protein